jgi:hypothetical protein
MEENSRRQNAGLVSNSKGDRDSKAVATEKWMENGKTRFLLTEGALQALGGKEESEIRILPDLREAAETARTSRQKRTRVGGGEVG